MARTVLGKRARDTATAGSSLHSSKVETRSRIVFFDDENVDPASAGHDATNEDHDDIADIDVPNAKRVFHARSSKRLCRLASRKSPLKRAALAPRDDNGQTTCFASPGDQDDLDQLQTPSTPRHRDTICGRIPVTPSHRIGVVGKTLVPRSSRTPSTPGNVPTVYNAAQRLFTQGATPGSLVGRHVERCELESFLEAGVESQAGRCLYVSGPPGTGKSALTSEICRTWASTNNVKTAHINCMSVKSANDIYRKLVDQFSCDPQVFFDDDRAELYSILVPKNEINGLMYVVTLDELDHLLGIDLDILYTLFEWSSRKASRLMLIGIANALDLTDRFLPRLKARNIKPQLLPFLPYTANQVADIITSKLRSLLPGDHSDEDGFVPILQPVAIQLCSKKVASQSGDLRKAFDVVGRTINVIDAEIRRQYLKEGSSDGTPDSPSRSPPTERTNARTLSMGRIENVAASLAALTPVTAPRATIAHVARVSATAFANGTSQRLATLNLQQKTALCALLKHNKVLPEASSSHAFPTKTSVASPTIRELYKTYRALCKQNKALNPLTATEFADVIGGLESLGLVGEETSGRGLGTAFGMPDRRSKGVNAIAGVRKRMVVLVNYTEFENCLGSVDGSIVKRLLQDNI